MNNIIWRLRAIGMLIVFLTNPLSLCHATEPTENDKSLLWSVIAADGQTSYIFGTMHADDSRITAFSPQLRSALQAAAYFWMEVLPPSDASLFNTKGKTASQLLNPQEFGQVMTLAAEYGIDSESVSHIKPWLLAIMLDQPRQSSPFPQDLQLMALARQQHKPVAGLETPEEHFGLFDDLSPKEQATWLRTVLKHNDADKQQAFDQLLQAYLSADIGHIAQLDAQLSGAPLPPALWEKMRYKLLDVRNARMADRIIAQLQADKTLFVAVGAAHLAGTGGLLAKLRAAGYTVKPVVQDLQPE